jgi:hypothetical protein
MRSVSIVVFILAAATLLAVVVLFIWRRRRPAVVLRQRRLWLNERTLFATTYEQLGVARPEPPTTVEDGTACLAYEDLALDATPTAEATAIVSMDALFPATPIRDERV